MRRICLVLLTALLPSVSPGQNSAVAWWSLEGQYGYALTGVSAIASAVGEEAIGRMSMGNTVVMGGFLANQRMWGGVTAIGAASRQVPLASELQQNYPNPFNPTTVIRFGLSQRSQADLSVFNTIGQQVAVLFQGEAAAGYHHVKFDGSNLASGVYFYRLQAGDFVSTKRMLVLK